MEKLLTWIRHNAPLAVGIYICALVCVYAYGCESKGASVLTPGIKVTKEELSLEVKQLTAEHELKLNKAELSLEQIAKEDEFKRRVFEFGAAIVETGQFNPTGLLGLLGWVMGGSAYLNGRKKDVIIARDRSA